MAWREQNLLMADRPAETFGFSEPPVEQLRRGIAWQQQAPATRWLLVQGTALAPCVDQAATVALGGANRRHWWLLPGAATSTCP